MPCSLPIRTRQKRFLIDEWRICKIFLDRLFRFRSSLRYFFTIRSLTEDEGKHERSLVRDSRQKAQDDVHVDVRGEGVCDAESTQAKHRNAESSSSPKTANKWEGEN